MLIVDPDNCEDIKCVSWLNQQEGAFISKVGYWKYQNSADFKVNYFGWDFMMQI